MEQQSPEPESTQLEALRPSDDWAEGTRSSARLWGQHPVSSAVPSSGHSREVQMGVRALVELQHASLLRVIGRLLLYAGLPASLIVVAFQRRIDHHTLWLAFELGAMSVATYFCRRESLALGTRKRMVSMALVVVALSALVHFGPLLGVGFVFVFALLVGAVLLERRQTLLLALVLVTGILLIALLQLYSPSPIYTPEVVLSEAQWLRVATGSGIGLVAILFVFQRLQSSLWRSLEKEISGRFRERRLVAEREKVLRGAAVTQRLESLGRLAGGVAHDFNNALVVIQCGIESLQEELDPAERREIVEELRAGVDRAASTAKQLLSFAKRNVEDIGECSPHAVLVRLSREVARLFPAHVELEVTIQPDAPVVAVSEMAFDQMVLNLVGNSLDALRVDGGKVRVVAELEKASGGLVLSVEDNGPGIPPEIADQVFEPFFTTKGDQATGLGLATVWGIVHRHGGEVTMDSVVGRGTRITLRLPASGPSPSGPVVLNPMIVLKENQKPRVLVLEDELPVRAALRRILKNLDFEVTETGTVAEARKACAASEFSLLISDGVVPDGGVGAFIHEFRSQQDGAPVILCSGYLEEDLAIDGIVQGKCAYLAKPFAAAELTELVHRVLLDERGPSTLESL